MKTLPCPPEETLLALLLGDDPGEDRTHTEGCPDCRRRLARLRSEVDALRSWTWPPAVKAERRAEVPSSIGRYPVVGPLGSGGQGQVYRGLHPRLGVEVAIKWGSRELGPDLARRDALVAEGRLLAQLNHPHLVRVFDLDVHEGRPFLVMEYVPGGDLEARVRAGGVRPGQAALWVAQLARGLAEAHARGVTHQDIKPSNVLLDAAGRARLGDFGLARLFAGAGADDEPLGGTLAFMAPEQARKEVEKIGPASDVFGLGGVLYFLLTGRAPHPAADAAGSPGDNPVLARQRAAEEKVDFAALEKAGVPAPLAAICRRALAARPEERYPSAAAMGGELESYLNRPSWGPRLGVILGALLLLGGAALAVFWPRRPPIPEGHQPLVEQVVRGGDARGDLRDVISLKKDDQYKIACTVPRGYHVALFSVDSAGTVRREEDFAVSREGRFDRLTFPPGTGTLRQTGDPGTELVLVVASRAAVPAEEIEALLREGGTWPDFPPGAFLSLTTDEVRAVIGSGQARPYERSREDPLRKALGRLEELRRQLSGRCDFFVGIVYRYDR